MSSKIAALIKTLIFTVFVPGTVAVYVPYLLLPPGAKVAARRVQWLGALLIAFGAVVYLRCAWDFATRGRGTPAIIDPPKRLVSTGFHRFVRNPMYVGVVSAILGEAVLFASPNLLIYALAAGVFFHSFVVFYEEPNLRKKFGADYITYCKTTPRWIPKLRGRTK